MREDHYRQVARRQYYLRDRIEALFSDEIKREKRLSKRRIRWHLRRSATQRLVAAANVNSS